MSLFITKLWIHPDGITARMNIPCHLLLIYQSQAWEYNANRLSILLLRLGYLMPGGYIPRLEIMERECWKFLDWRLNSDNDSRLHGQPSSSYSFSWLNTYPRPVMRLRHLREKTDNRLQAQSWLNGYSLPFPCWLVSYEVVHQSWRDFFLMDCTGEENQKTNSSKDKPWIQSS